MPRPFGIAKRNPRIDPVLFGRYAKMSKADWAEVARDLYQQIYGDTSTDTDWMADAEHRRQLLQPR